MLGENVSFILFVICFSQVSEGKESETLNAQTKTTKSTQKRKSGAKNKHITVPIEIGVGPSMYHLGAMNGSDRLAHSAMSISGYAIISKKLIRKNKHLIPKEYRKMAMAQEEMRISKLWIPESIILSPSQTGTSAIGASFRPVGINLISSKKRQGLNLDLGARLTYAYVNSSDPTLTTPHFIGLGIDAKAEYRIPLTKKNSLGLGWSSHIYLPQSSFSQAESGTIPLEPSNWHVGQAIFKYYTRFPYKYTP